MRSIKFSLITFCMMSGLGYAGGDITPITPYETEDEIISEQAYEEEYIEQPLEEPVVEERIYVEPEPASVTTPVKPVATIPAVVATKPSLASKSTIQSNGFYVGLGITGVRYDSGCDCKKQDTKDTSYGGVVRLGYDFNRYVGIEARGAKTNGDSDVDHMGIYLKPMIPITKQSNIYGLIGAAKTKIKGDLPHVDADSLALGGGIEVDLSEDTPKEGRYSRSFDGEGDQERGLGLFVDYERMIVKDDAPDVDAVSAGVTYDF